MIPGWPVSGLFRRIYATFVLTVVGAAIVAGAGTWFVGAQLHQRWVVDTWESILDENDALVAALDSPRALADHSARLAATHRTLVAIYDRDGSKLAGDGPDALHRGFRRRARGSEPGTRGSRGLLGRQTLLVPLRDPSSRRPVAWVRATTRPGGLVIPIGVSVALTLALLGLGARGLSRSLTRRLSLLERSADRIAKGDLGHRVGLDPTRVDELEQLGQAFNHMAERVQALVVGQKTLLTNVSHELRTPIARIKVLLEILEERLEGLRGVPLDPPSEAHVVRLAAGIADLGRDTEEIETLISDLLASGRLELDARAESSLRRDVVDLVALARRIAPKFDAEVHAPEDAVEVEGDAMLLERLLSNLLANARRHGPRGTILVRLAATSSGARVCVDDDGPGIAPADRDRIFEPFTRLDSARNRDRGGVGLGLHLCRQIATAHRGTIVATSKPDGTAGARFEVELPRGDAARSSLR